MYGTIESLPISLEILSHIALINTKKKRKETEWVETMNRANTLEKP
jgi:hypothetical protein